jgi:glucokinase
VAISAPSRPQRPAAVIAVDIGGTSLKSAILAAGGTVLYRRQVGSYSVDNDPLKSLQRLTSHLVRVANDREIDLHAIGLASPGLVDSDRGEVLYAANLRWRNLPLAQILAAEFSVPVFLDHDARAGAIAERAAQDASASDDFIFVPIGTGVSAAVVAAGTVVRGAAWGAGEFGHMPVMTGAEACTCGGRGCIEAYASASSVLGRYRARGATAANSTPELVARLTTDADARAVWADLIEALAIGLSSLSAVLDPSRIIIGGGLSLAGDALLTPLATEISARLPWRKSPRLLQSALASHAGLIGAGLIALRQHATDPEEFAASVARSLSAPKSSSSST